MYNARIDQAAGLRRLCGGVPRQVVSVTAASRGAGRTAFIIGVALALAALGRRVLVIDENSGIGNVNDTLRLGLRYDLWHALCDGRQWREVVQAAHPRINVLPAARAARMADGVPHQTCAAVMAQIAATADVVLVDALPESAGRGWEVEGETRHWVLLPAGAVAVTAAYALIKRITQSVTSSNRIEVVVSRVRNAAEGAAIHANLAGVARRYLQLTPALSGTWIADRAIAALLRGGRALEAIDSDHRLLRHGASFASRLAGAATEGAVADAEPPFAGSMQPKMAAAWEAP